MVKKCIWIIAPGPYNNRFLYTSAYWRVILQNIFLSTGEKTKPEFWIKLIRLHLRFSLGCGIHSLEEGTM